MRAASDFHLTDEEVPFGFEELFFSRTDAHGIIRSGNGVFQRVSGYSWDELIGKPHKLVRNPDMPRAVFWLLWDTIKRGEPIGAYVKNRAKDGRPYWVFAIISPTDGGYLSVRVKPDSDLFASVKQEYAALRARELAQDTPPADSAAALLARLAELGYRNYQAFMSDAIRAEIAARDSKLGTAQDGNIRRFGDIVQAARSVLDQADQVFTTFSRNEHVALNFQVQAAQLGAAGAAIGQISKNYEMISNEIKRSLDRFVTSARQVAVTVDSGAFLTSMARVQQEMFEVFRRETSAGDAVCSGEMPLLEEQVRSWRKKAADGLASIRNEADAFFDACADMKRLAAALEVTRIMGKVESARTDCARTSLSELIIDLEVMQKSIADGLKQIEQFNHGVVNGTNALLERSRFARAC